MMDVGSALAKNPTTSGLGTSEMVRHNEGMRRSFLIIATEDRHYYHQHSLVNRVFDKYWKYRINCAYQLRLLAIMNDSISKRKMQQILIQRKITALDSYNIHVLPKKERQV